MNSFFQLAEVATAECKLSAFAKEFSNKSLDYKELDKPIDKAKEVENDKKGGAYKDLPSVEGKQKHHMPAASVSDLPYHDGPCLLMEEADHKQTASYGNSKEAQEYRGKQKELIDQGKFDEALQLDINDIQEKFGNKYDEGIAELKEYYEALKQEGKAE